MAGDSVLALIERDVKAATRALRADLRENGNITTNATREACERVARVILDAVNHQGAVDGIAEARKLLIAALDAPNDGQRKRYVKKAADHLHHVGGGS